VNPKLNNNSLQLGRIISSPKDVDGYSTKKARYDELLILENESLLDGSIREYIHDWQYRILEANHPKTIAAKIKNKEPWYLLPSIKCDGIIFGYIIRQDMRFILNDSGAVVRDNFYIISPKIDSHLMMALLNNYYTYIQLEISGKRYGGGLLKLQKYDLESLVFPSFGEINKENEKKLISYGRELVDGGDQNLLDRISEVLSVYAEVGLEEVKSQFESIKNKRLEGNYGQ